MSVANLVQHMRRIQRVDFPAKLTGEAVPKDVQGGLSELDGLCARGEGSACADLMSLFSKGLGTDVAPDPARVRATAQKGCKAHDEGSCHVQALLEQQDHLGTTTAQTVAPLDATCKAGVLRDCGSLGEALLPTDRARALELLDRACKGGVAQSCQKLTEAGGR